MVVSTRHFLVVQQIPHPHLSQVHHLCPNYHTVQHHHLTWMHQGFLRDKMSSVMAVPQWKGTLRPHHSLILVVSLAHRRWVLTVFFNLQVYNDTESSSTYFTGLYILFINSLIEPPWAVSESMVSALLMYVVVHYLFSEQLIIALFSYQPPSFVPSCPWPLSFSSRLVLVLDPNGLSLGAGAVIGMLQLPLMVLCWIAQSPLIFIMFHLRFYLGLGPWPFYVWWVNYFLLDFLTDRLSRCVVFRCGFLLVGFMWGALVGILANHVSHRTL